MNEKVTHLTFETLFSGMNEIIRSHCIIIVLFLILILVYFRQRKVYQQNTSSFVMMQQQLDDSKQIANSDGLSFDPNFYKAIKEVGFFVL